MSEHLKKQIDELDIPVELSKRSELGVKRAKLEMPKSRFFKKWIGALAIAAALVITTSVVYEQMQESTSEYSKADMLGMIVYKGEIYVQTNEGMLPPKVASRLKGQKLGISKDTIDEWSDKAAYNEEFASTIGKQPVYSVKGYDENFRIMTYEKESAQIFEHIDEQGADVFNQMKLKDNIASAVYQDNNEWYEGSETFHKVTNQQALEQFVEALYVATPVESPTERADLKHLTFTLKDGTTATLILFKKNHTVHYGFMGIDFKVEKEAFDALWNSL